MTKILDDDWSRKVLLFIIYTAVAIEIKPGFNGRKAKNVTSNVRYEYESNSISIPKLNTKIKHSEYTFVNINIPY